MPGGDLAGWQIHRRRQVPCDAAGGTAHGGTGAGAQGFPSTPPPLGWASCTWPVCARLVQMTCTLLVGPVCPSSRLFFLCLPATAQLAWAAVGAALSA